MALSFWTWCEAECSGSRSAWERFRDAGSRERESTGRDQGETQPGGHSLAVLLPSKRPHLLLLSPSKLSPHQLHQRIQPFIAGSQTLLGLFWKSGASHTFWESLSFPRVLWKVGRLLSREAKSSPSLCHLDARDKLATGMHCGLP